ncbi:MAG TPA: prepilin-type N-terminal cleavage/methylation domain-containing protein [Vicinamibacterales bacterium]|nr:prepilin-type N-terminal cleavage/methylation domain-containing protein [Vicinamibacterales bacterium]
MIKKMLQAVGERGFSLVESLVALVLMLVVTGAVFGLLNPSSMASRTQPEAIDVQQRARVGIDAIQRDLLAAGAGLGSGPAVGPLVNYHAPVVPRRMGLQSADAYNLARADAITIQRAAGSYVQTTVRDPMAPGALDLTVNEPPNCPSRNGVCGLSQDMTILVFDPISNFDSFVIRQVQAQTVSLLSRQRSPSAGYAPGAYVAEAEFDTYWHDPAMRQLRHYDGYQTDVPVVDNVVALGFEYFGDPDPPTRPKPPLGTANCLYDAAGNAISGLSQLPPQGGSLAPLSLSTLSDGPWCGAGDNRFDADLLRIRRVRVTIRIQATQAGHRGTGADYVNPGFAKSSQLAVPDYLAVFDVAPRNLNLGR